MARLKLSDLGKPDPLEFENEDGSIAFVMPRRVTHLSKLEKVEFERLANENHRAAIALVDHQRASVHAAAAGAKDPAAVAERDQVSRELAAKSEDTQFAFVSMILPGITRSQYDGLSSATIAAIVEEFVSVPFVQKTVDPETSV